MSDTTDKSIIDAKKAIGKITPIKFEIKITYKENEKNKEISKNYSVAKGTTWGEFIQQNSTLYHPKQITDKPEYKENVFVISDKDNLYLTPSQHPDYENCICVKYGNSINWVTLKLNQTNVKIDNEITEGVYTN